ncbi:MAG: anthranilate synthase component II [Candidatus Acetothermia bacterium]
MKPNSQKKRRFVVIDNYDSFTYNLVQYLGELGLEPLVFRNDEIELKRLRKLEPEGLLISPGPGRPNDTRYFGLSLEVLKTLSPEVPTIGVCLGHQGIGVAFGGRVKPAKDLYHGKTSKIQHDCRGVFAGLPDEFTAARYHSLVLSPESLPEKINVTARTTEGEIMGIRHDDYPIHGVQFHPESILTEKGMEILKNFLRICRSDTR